MELDWQVAGVAGATGAVGSELLTVLEEPKSAGYPAGCEGERKTNRRAVERGTGRNRRAR